MRRSKRKPRSTSLTRGEARVLSADNMRLRRELADATWKPTLADRVWSLMLAANDGLRFLVHVGIRASVLTLVLAGGRATFPTMGADDVTTVVAAITMAVVAWLVMDRAEVV